MPATKISDLLPYPEGTTKPHAYQVFGLEGGEQDAEKIKAAVAQVYEKLREAKADADPRLWRKAANAVEKARSILSNPQKRAALDARFGVINFDDVHKNPSAPDPLAAVLPTSDPLASMLPSSDPLAAVVPVGNPMAVASPPAPVPGTAPIGTAPVSQAQSAGTATATAPAFAAAPITAGDPQNHPGATAVAAPTSGAGPTIFKPKKSSRYRRKSALGNLMFGFLAVAMLAIIGGLGYMIFNNQQILITTGEQQQPDPARQVANVQPVNVKPVNKDPVLGDVPGGPAKPIGSLNNPDPIASPDPMPPAVEMRPSPTPPVTPEQPAPVSPTPPDPPMEKPEPETPETPEKPTVLPVQPAGPGPPVEMTDEMIKAANDEIAKVEMLIKQAKWDEMKPAADKLTEMTLTAEQQVHADALYNLADLATFYRGGIIKGIGTLNTAATFDISDGVPVLVVETSATGLTIRANARNRDYTVDTMPFSLADRLASFKMSQDDPDTIAARSCFHAISPKANEEYRKDAVNWLEFINDDVEGVDTTEVVKVIKKLFPDAN